MTLIGQSERRDVDCLNRLKVALASRRTPFEALKRAVADVRQCGLVEAEGLANVGEKRLLVGSLEDIAAERDCVLAKTEFVSAKGMESWYHKHHANMFSYVRWFFRLIMEELDNREKETRAALMRVTPGRGGDAAGQ